MPEDAYLTRDEFLAYKKAAEKELEVQQLRYKDQELRAEKIEYELLAVCGSFGVIGIFGVYEVMNLVHKYTGTNADNETASVTVVGMGILGLFALLGFGSSYAKLRQIQKNTRKIGDLEKELENIKAQPAYRNLAAIAQE